MEKSVGIIPARLDSNRFPGKVFKNFFGKPILSNVIHNAKKFNFIDDLYVVSDQMEIIDFVKKKHPDIKHHLIKNRACCGTHAAYRFYTETFNHNYYISIPADEPAINAYEINKTFKNIKSINSEEIITLYTKFYKCSDILSRLSCKIVSSSDDYMKYGSRCVIPRSKGGHMVDLNVYKKHLGICVFPVEVFLYHGESLWEDDDIESLEQNRFLSKVRVKLYETSHMGFGIDVESQIKSLEKRILENGKFYNTTHL